VGAFHLRDARGARIPVAAELVQPERELFRIRVPKRFASLLLGAFGEELAGNPVREADWEIRDGLLDLRVRVSELAAGFDVAGARRRLEADLARDEVESLDVRVTLSPRIRLRFADALPGCGLRVYRLARGRARPAREAPVTCGRDPSGGAWVENEHWRVEVGADGRVSLRRRGGGLVVEDAVRVVSEGDRGDEYNFDPVPDEEPVERPERTRIALERAGEARAAVVVDARYRVPEGLARDRKTRSARRVALPVRLRLALHENLDSVDLELSCDNRARDHRLRVHVRAPFGARRFEVESAFEVAERPIAPGPGDFGSPRPSELPIGTVPQRRFAAIDDGALALSLANRGAAEVEAVPEADGTTSLAVTLLRGVGWLSRDDLRLRPGHAGPPFETPGAQVPGPQRQQLSLRLHPVGEAARAARAHAFACPPVAFPGGESPGGPLGDGARLVEVDDPEVVVSAVEPRSDGRCIVRLWNASGAERRVRVAWNGPGARGLQAIDLAERPAPDLALEAVGPGACVLRLRPWQIATLRVQ
jgi:hypothetical protein